MEKTEEIVFGIVKSLYKWENDHSIMPADMIYYHNKLTRQLIENGSTRFPGNLHEFIKLLRKPLNEWGVNLTGVVESMSEKRMLTVFGALNPEFVEWMNEIQSIENTEQKYMFEFLVTCRSLYKKTGDAAFIEYYRKGRSFICPDNAIIEKLDLEEFLDKFPDELRKSLRNLYQPFDTAHDRVFLCPICGYPVSFEFKKEGACGSEICKELKRDQEPKQLNVKNKKFHILTKGAYLFILLPSISENKIYNSLRQKYKDCMVELYPDIDLYDIRISKGNRIINLDIKDHKSPEKLVESIVQNSQIQKYNPEHQTFLVIPNYRKALNPVYKESVLAEFKLRNMHIKTVYEYELDRKIDNFMNGRCE